MGQPPPPAWRALAGVACLLAPQGARAGEPLTDVQARAGAAHALGGDADIRGVLDLGVGVTAWRGDGWALELATDLETVVRSNRPTETAFRISPRRAVYGAEAALWLGGQAGGGGPGDARWALTARHRSHHDIDEDDHAGNVETIAYEVYGVCWRPVRPGPGAALTLVAGLYYDRGTTLDGRRQNLPFEHYLAGVEADGWLAAVGPLYVSGAAALIATRDRGRSPVPHVSVSGQAEAGWRHAGPAAEVRAGLALRRIEDYLRIGDEPRRLLLLTVTVRTAPAAR